MIDYSFNLTTTPERLEERVSLEKTLESLNNQTSPPRKIRIAIPEYYIRWKKYYNSIPKWLTAIPIVAIVRCNDYGPATKWMCATHADTEYVIVCDDDRYFHNDTSAKLIKAINDIKCDSISFYGMWWWIDPDDQSKGVDESFMICQAADAWITRTECLKDYPKFWYRAFNYFEQSFYVDDVLTSAYMLYKDIEYTCIDYDKDNENVTSAEDLPTTFSKYSLLNIHDIEKKWLRKRQQTEVRDNMLEMIKNETNLDTFPENMTIELTENLVRNDGTSINPTFFSN